MNTTSAIIHMDPHAIDEHATTNLVDGSSKTAENGYVNWGPIISRFRKKMHPKTEKSSTSDEISAVYESMLAAIRPYGYGNKTQRKPKEMHDPLNLNEVRHEQRRVAALLNQSKHLEMHAVPYSGIPLDQLYKSRYHDQLMNGGAIATSSSWDTEPHAARLPKGGRVIGDAMNGRRKTLAEKAFEHMDKLNFPNKHSNMRKVHDANRKIISDGKKINSDFSETPVRRDSVTKSENFRERARGRRNSLTRPLGGVLDIKSQSLRESLMISSREGAREAPYRLPKKQDITRNLEVAIARSRRNKTNVEGKNLRPLKIPTGQSNWDKSDSPVVHLKYKHDSKGKGLNLGLRFSDKVTEISPVPFTPPPIKIPTDRVDSASSGVGSYSAHSTSYDDTVPLSPPISRVSSGFGTYRTEENEDCDQHAQKSNEDRLSREHTADVLWFQRHGHTKSAWLRKRMRDEAAKRKREAEVLRQRQLDKMVDDEDEENMANPNYGMHDAPPTKHAHMEAYRQAYIKALAVARSRALPQEPWLLGTRTSRSFTFSYFAHVPTCSCGQCHLKNKEANPVKRGQEMKAIFGNVKMMDYFKPPRVVRSKRRFNKKKRDVEKTLMGSLTEESEAATKDGQEKKRLILPPINGATSDQCHRDNEHADDGSDEDNSNNVDDPNGIPGEENEDTISDKEDKLSSRGTLSDDEEGVMASKNDTSKKSEETSGYDSESSGET
ncbi:uncharacterized protein LOC144351328 [Saccoglossus kowalevskii]